MLSMMQNTWWLVCWSLTSLCDSNGHIETMPGREINPFTALTRIWSQFLRTQWSTSNHQRVDTTTPQTAQPSGLAAKYMKYLTNNMVVWPLFGHICTDFAILSIIAIFTFILLYLHILVLFTNISSHLLWFSHIYPKRSMWRCSNNDITLQIEM